MKNHIVPGKVNRTLLESAHNLRAARIDALPALMPTQYCAADEICPVIK
jgi:hypothetical protein